MSTLSYAGGSALSHALHGLRSSSGAMRVAAGQVAKETVKAANGKSSSGDTVTLSDAAKDGESGIEEGLLAAQQAEAAYAASARHVETDDEQFQSMLDILLPGF